MKKFAAAVAALVIVGAGLSAAPAYADTAEPSDVIVSSVAPPVEVTRSHAREIPTSQPATNAAPDAAPADAGTAVISGTADFEGHALQGAIVTAFLFDTNGKQTFESASVTTDASGQFSITGLAAGDYWVQYEEHTNPQMPSYQWWGSDLLHPYGTFATVADGATRDFSWNLTTMSGVLGTVTCSTCSAAPDPATVTILVGAYDPSTQLYQFIDGGHPAADGSFGFNSLFPYNDYRIFAKYTGTEPFNKSSNSRRFTMTAGAYAASSVIVSRHIDLVPGYTDRYGQADASVVNALYFDFLKRLPSPPETKGWVQQLYNGTEPSAVSAGFVNSDEYRLIRIDAAYQNILGRASDPSGRADWLNNMKAGRITTDDIETSFYASAEYFAKHGGTNVSFTQSLYTTLLHRPGSQSEWDFWANLAAKNGRDWVIKQFWDATETISERVSLMYATYLGRTPDASGLRDWVGVALAIGDSGLRSGLSGSEEYYIRSQDRFRNS